MCVDLILDRIHEVIFICILYCKSCNVRCNVISVICVDLIVDRIHEVIFICILYCKSCNVRCNVISVISVKKKVFHLLDPFRKDHGLVKTGHAHVHSTECSVVHCATGTGTCGS